MWRSNIRPIHLAAERGNLHILAAVLLSLIERTMNFQLNVETDEGQDPLDLAITYGHIECAAMLCQAGLQIKNMKAIPTCKTVVSWLDFRSDLL